MFVCPPPLTGFTNQVLPPLLNKGISDSFKKTEQHFSIFNSIDGVKNFVSAPPEYTDRARDEIRKVLSKRSHNSHPSFRSRRSSDSNSSIFESMSGDSSTFSNCSVITQSTEASSLSELEHYKCMVITLEDALPKFFYDMYYPEIVMNPQNLLPNGRPKFTKRELLDWDLNDIRSLLIIEKVKPEWGTHLPVIHFGSALDTTYRYSEVPPQFKIQLLPLNSPDEIIIDILVNSDIYKEAQLDFQFKLTSARYTVAAARRRHRELAGVDSPVMHLSKPEWRNIIENYLLNLAVEAQCRFDFKNSCLEFKKWKLHTASSPAVPLKQETSLLRRALLRNTRLKYTGEQERQSISSSKNKISISKEEKNILWVQCQSKVYQRLGLDWTPDSI